MSFSRHRHIDFYKRTNYTVKIVAKLFFIYNAYMKNLNIPYTVKYIHVKFRHLDQYHDPVTAVFEYFDESANMENVPIELDRLKTILSIIILPSNSLHKPPRKLTKDDFNFLNMLYKKIDIKYGENSETMEV